MAAIDLGSNSFHMVIAREADDGSITIIDKVREMVRLGAGLSESGVLSAETRDRALHCLKRFKQRLKSIPAHRVRAVGTNTFRAAKNRDAFLRQAESALGHHISIISGHEEARLVYLGAAFDLTVSNKQRLVIDIGGGSTELTIGQGFEPSVMDSLYMGCVSLTRRVFGNGEITSLKIQQAERIVSRELETVLERYRMTGWDEVVGTSGTIKAIDNVARALGVKKDWVSIEGINQIREWVLEKGHSHYLDQVSDQRRPVFIGGFVILSTIFRDLGIERMDISQGALREGVAYELIGRLHNRDSRFDGVNALKAKFQPDEKQIHRVNSLALRLYQQVGKDWGLNTDLDRKLLIWAAQLHEIGMAISYNHHHQHSAYIVENSDINGFSRQIQRVLAVILRNGRQKLNIEQSEWLETGFLERVVKLTIILRLAVTIFRGRIDFDTRDIRCKARDNSIQLMVNKRWADEHPLTIYDLEAEKQYLEAKKYELSVIFESE